MSERKCQSSLVWPALLAGLILLPALDAKAEVESPIQSMVRPLGLATSGRVHAAASDQKSAEFQKNALPKILDVIRTNLPEQKAIPDSFFKYGTPVPGRDALSLDPAQIKLEFDANVRVYFLGEGAGYQNSLGYYTTPSSEGSSGDSKEGSEYKSESSESKEKELASTSNGEQKYDKGLLGETNAKLIFPNASSNNSYLNDGGKDKDQRTASAPLQAGDFVNLGKMKAGEIFNPFVISNGAAGGTSVFTGDVSKNSDHIQHFVALAITSIANNPYLIFGVEDMKGGGDRDYNDVLYAVDLGKSNLHHLASASVPLPSSTVAVFGPLVCLVWAAARRRLRNKPVAE